MRKEKTNPVTITNKESAIEPNVWKILQILIGLGILLELVASFKSLWSNNGQIPLVDRLANVLTYFGTSLVIGGACYCIGGLTGFLFGIPRLLQNSSMPDEVRNNPSKLVQNDNLVQISDWLTKIIVGVGLTQIYSIVPALSQMGIFLSPSFGGSSSLAVGSVLFFLNVGFFSGYLWTRLYFYKRLAITSLEVDELQKEKEQAEKEKEDAQEQKNQSQSEVKGMYNTLNQYIQSLRLENHFTAEQLNDDPNKGKFGGSNIVNDRKISARISEASFSTEWYIIILEVISTNLNNPLKGDVVFYLHPTFPEPERRVKPVDGIAKLELLGWGAFTIGAECDEGKTKLEIDLAKDVPSAPKAFTER